MFCESVKLPWALPMHVLHICILTSWVFLFIVLLLHLILHTAQPAAVTTVAMETCGVSQEKALNRREKKMERRDKRQGSTRRKKERNGKLRKGQRGLESGQERAEECEDNKRKIMRG